MSQTSEKTCQDCGKTQKSKSIIWFKGKFRCFLCKRRAGKKMYLPTNNPSNSTLKKIPLFLPRVRTRKKIEIKDLPEDNGKIMSVGLTRGERGLIYRHLSLEGFDYKTIQKKIEEMDRVIKDSHIQYKNGLKKDKTDFRSEFEKLIKGGK